MYIVCEVPAKKNLHFSVHLMNTIRQIQLSSVKHLRHNKIKGYGKEFFKLKPRVWVNTYECGIGSSEL